MRVVVITPPDPVVTWEEARDHLKLDGDDEQTMVEAFVAAATAHIDGPDGWLGRCIGVQTLEAYLPSFGVVSIGLPYAPAVDVASIDYVNEAGAPAALPSDAFELRGSLLRPAWPNTWPLAAWRGSGGETVRIRYRAGYETVPAPIRAAILLMAGDLYRFRDTVSTTSAVPVPMSTTVQTLLSPFRVWR